MSKVIVLGGYGSFGRMVSLELAQLDQVQLIIAGRNLEKGLKYSRSLGVDFAECDVSNPRSLQAILEDAFLLINTTGPFQEPNYLVPELCIKAGCHYLDIADGRDHVSGITQLHEKACANSVFVCSGASAVPAITSILVEAISKDFADIVEIRSALSPGNKNPRGSSTIKSILTTLGRPIRLRKGGKWVESIAWTEAEVVNFPHPIGRRRVQLSDAPDFELFPTIFGANTVTFKAGLELDLFNFSLAILTRVRQVAPKLDLVRYAELFIKLSLLTYPLGSPKGALGVWVVGRKDDNYIERCLAIVALKNGPMVAASPAIILGRKIISEGIPKVGAYPCIGFIRLEELSEFLFEQGIQVVQGDERGWPPKS